jgi:hypothetical protein
MTIGENATQESTLISGFSPVTLVCGARFPRIVHGPSKAYTEWDGHHRVNRMYVFK